MMARAEVLPASLAALTSLALAGGYTIRPPRLVMETLTCATGGWKLREQRRKRVMLRIASTMEK